MNQALTNTLVNAQIIVDISYKYGVVAYPFLTVAYPFLKESNPCLYVKHLFREGNLSITGLRYVVCHYYLSGRPLSKYPYERSAPEPISLASRAQFTVAGP